MGAQFSTRFAQVSPECLEKIFPWGIRDRATLKHPGNRPESTFHQNTRDDVRTPKTHRHALKLIPSYFFFPETFFPL